ncbi:MAG: DUF4145 domain-containing protein [Alphaproteobacteria bacterium]
MTENHPSFRYEPPGLGKSGFNCSRCGSKSAQSWFLLRVKRILRDDPAPQVPSVESMVNLNAIFRSRHNEPKKIAALDEYVEIAPKGEAFINNFYAPESQHCSRLDNCWVSSCYSCRQVTIWVGETIVWPPPAGGPPPNNDLPDDIKSIYNEASRVKNVSPRSASALLRLCIEKLCLAEGCKKDKLNNMIGKLVEKGLDPTIQQAYDIVRLKGNTAIHPAGEIELSDTADTAEKLFSIVNIIANHFVSNKKLIAELYDNLSPGEKKQIENRDSKPQNQ